MDVKSTENMLISGVVHTHIVYALCSVLYIQLYIVNKRRSWFSALNSIFLLGWNSIFSHPLFYIYTYHSILRVSFFSLLQSVLTLTADSMRVYFYLQFNLLDMKTPIFDTFSFENDIEEQKAFTFCTVCCGWILNCIHICTYTLRVKKILGMKLIFRSSTTLYQNLFLLFFFSRNVYPFQ